MTQEEQNQLNAFGKEFYEWLKHNKSILSAPEIAAIFYVLIDMSRSTHFELNEPRKSFVDDLGDMLDLFQKFADTSLKGWNDAYEAFEERKIKKNN